MRSPQAGQDFPRGVLVFSTAARGDLAEIEAYIEEASRSGETAQNFVEPIIRKCNRLADFKTRISRPRSELLPDLRSFPFRNDVIFFRCTSDTVYVINILYGARDIDALFDSDKPL